MKKRITKTTVESMRADDLVWDTGLTGFGARNRSGAVTYLVKYRAARGRARWLTIGKHGGPWVDRDGNACTLTAELARQEALRLLGEAVRGGDPAAKRDHARALPTVKDFAKRYLEEHAVPHKKPRSVEEDRRNLDSHILPALGRMRVDQIIRADVVRFHLGRKANPYNANRCLALLSHMMTMAERWGLRPDGSNPCRHVERFREKKRKRYLSETEFGRLAVALADAEDDYPRAVAAIRLLIFTGARRNEILELEWERVNLDRGVLDLGDSKTGPKPIHLSAPAVQLLASLPRVAGSPFVFPSRTGGHFSGLQKVWTAIRTAAHLEDVRLHDLRHSFASILVSGGASLPLIGGLLGHTTPATTARYAHLSDDPLRSAAEKAGSLIDSAMQRGIEKELEDVEEA